MYGRVEVESEVLETGALDDVTVENEVGEGEDNALVLGVTEVDDALMEDALVDGALVDGALVDDAPVDDALVLGVTEVDDTFVDDTPVEDALVNDAPVDDAEAAKDVDEVTDDEAD